MTRRCPYCDEEIRENASKCKNCLSWLGPGPEPGSREARSPLWEVGPGKGGGAWNGMVRPKADRMIAGVCAALGRWLGVDPTLVRIGFLLGSFFTAIAPGVLLYIILMFVIPTEGSDNSWSP